MASSSNKSILDDNHTDDEVISFSGPGERAELDESDVQQNSDDEEDGAYEEQMKAIARKKINVSPLSKNSAIPNLIHSTDSSTEEAYACPKARNSMRRRRQL